MKYLKQFQSISIILIAFSINTFGNCIPPYQNNNQADSLLSIHLKEVIKKFSKKAYDNELRTQIQCGLNISRELSLTKINIKFLDVLSRYYIDKGAFDSARLCLEKGISLVNSKNIPISYKANLLNSLGNVATSRGDFIEAIQFYLKAKEIWDIKKKISKSIGMEFNIGMLYLEINQFEDGESIFEKTLQFGEETEDEYLIQISRSNLAFIYEKTGRLEEALSISKKVINSTQINYGNRVAYINTLRIGAKCAIQMDNIFLAKKFIKELSRYQDEKAKLNYFRAQAEFSLYFHNYKKTIFFLEEAIAMAKRLNDIILQKVISQQLSKAYEKVGDYKSAHLSNLAYHQIQDSLNSTAKEKNLNELISKYEARQKEQQILALQKLREHDQKIKFVIMVIAFLLLITAGIYYRSYILKRESATLLAMHVAKIDEQNLELTVKNDELQQFAYSVSHDLKLPVNAIRSYIQLAQRSMNSSPQTMVQHLQTAQANSISLSLLLEDLLRYTKVGKNNVETTDLNLNRIVQQVLSSLDSQITEREATIQCAPLPNITALYSDIYMLFQNLIQNAIKFTPISRKPEVSISYEAVPGFHQISISDNGIGLKEEHKKAIFRIFKRVNNRTEGTGIGLALVKKVMDYLEGEVQVQSILNEGSTFILKFPAPIT